MKTTPDFVFNHLGVAVTSIVKSQEFYENAFGFVQLTDVYHDTVQDVSVAFIGPPQDFKDRRPQAFVLELIEPGSDKSHLHRLLKTNVAAYHVCYAVTDIEGAILHLGSHGCLKVRGPEPAVAYFGKPIAWCFAPTRHLVELVQL